MVALLVAHLVVQRAELLATKTAEQKVDLKAENLAVMTGLSSAGSMAAWKGSCLAEQMAEPLGWSLVVSKVCWLVEQLAASMAVSLVVWLAPKTADLMVVLMVDQLVVETVALMVVR